MLNLFLNNCYLIGLRIINKFRKSIGKNSIIIQGKNVLEINFPEKSSFNFVQIGANDGVSFDFLYQFVTARDSKGLAIEPVRYYFDKLKNNYSDYANVFPLNVAIHSEEREVIIYNVNPKHTSIYPEWVKGIASLDINHLKKNGIFDSHILKNVVPAIPVENIFEYERCPTHIHYIQIDTEGYDYEILRRIPLLKIKPYVIRFEIVNLSQTNIKKAQRMLMDYGYFYFEDGTDGYAVDLRKIKLL